MTTLDFLPSKIPLTAFAPLCPVADKPLLLDAFCKAGGAGMGYHLAGFEVIGVDIEPQPRYPFRFIQADALDFIRLCGHWFDCIHASPPCQAYGVTKSLTTKEYPKLIETVRELLRATGKPYVIENVPGAPLKNTITLCGTMFGLKTIRHRLFETNPPLFWPPAQCQHVGRRAPKRLKDDAGRGVIHSFERVDLLCVVGHNFKVADGKVAIGADWMTGEELAEAIPPQIFRVDRKTTYEALNPMTCPTCPTCQSLTEENDTLAERLQDARAELASTATIRQQFAAVCAENLELRKRVQRLEREAERVRREAVEREKERQRDRAWRATRCP